MTLEEAINRASLMPVLLLLSIGLFIIFLYLLIFKHPRNKAQKYLLTYSFAISSMPLIWGINAPIFQQLFGWLEELPSNPYQLWDLAILSLTYLVTSGVFCWFACFAFPRRDSANSLH